MKSRHILYPLAIFLLALLPSVRYYISTPGINDCMTHYVQQMKYSNYQGYIYNIKGVPHIEPSNSTFIGPLEKYRVGTADGCLMTGEDLYSDFNNTIYCSITYLIQNAPMHSSLKKPLAIFDGGAFQL